MNLKPLGANQTEVYTDKVIVLFSYQTPVAYLDNSTGKTYRTSKYWSKTTTKHINKWLGADCGELIDQGKLDRLIVEVA
jgi:hypothetical protein